ncbi:MAG: PRC-barrel domain-containing protein [Desulfuromonadales bacterium]
MKKTALITALLFVAGSALASGAIAQERTGQEQDKPGALGQFESQERQQPGQQEQAQAQPQEQQNIRSADELEGAKIQNAQGEDLGELSQVLVDLEAGRIGYAVVASGGVLGMGENKYIVPFNALKVGQDNNLILDIPADKLKEAPQGNIEQALNQEQAREIHQFYGVSPYWEESGGQQGQQEEPSQIDQLMQDEPEQQQEQMQQKEQRY